MKIISLVINLERSVRLSRINLNWPGAQQRSEDLVERKNGRTQEVLQPQLARPATPPTPREFIRPPSPQQRCNQVAAHPNQSFGLQSILTSIFLKCLRTNLKATSAHGSSAFHQNSAEPSRSERWQVACMVSHSSIM